MHEAMDRLRVAAAEQERAVSLTARFQTLSYLGAALYAMGHASEAVTAFEQAVRVSPAPAPPTDLTLNLANACLAAGRREDARRALMTTLRNAPGHLEAQMLLQRLDQQPPDSPLTGAPLGESPESARKYLRTLTFSPVATGGGGPGTGEAGADAD